MSLSDWFRRARTPRQSTSVRRKECGHCGTALPEVARFCFLCGQEVSVAPAPGREDRAFPNDVLELGARLARALDGRYLVHDILGVGGMGVVFLADDLSLDRRVAIKVLPTELSSDPNVVARFRREARTAARLDHPGIIPIYRVESEDHLHYFIMKYAAGRSLEAILREDAPLAIPFVTRVLRDAAGALAHAHRHGVVHRDVKPGNIMLDADDRIILTDFGISKASSAASNATTVARFTEIGTVVGTPHYMAPEQAVGQPVDGRTDQYALAVVGFEMLTGRVPFDDVTPHAIIHRHLNDAPPSLTSVRSDVPAPLAGALARALLKSPTNRFSTMDEFAAALDGGSLEIGTNTRPTLQANGDRAPVAAVAGASSEPPAGRRRVAVWAAMITLLLSGLGAAAAWVSGGLDTPRPAVERSRPVSAEAKPVRAATPPRPREAPRRTVSLTIASTPRATVFIDGVRAGDTPLASRQLTVGRAYKIRVERKGYRTRQETITAGTRPIRRSYVLQRR